MGKSKMEKLSLEFEEFRRIPFPEDSDDNELSQLHADLVAYDSFIASQILALLGGSYVSLESLRFDEDLKIRLERIISQGFSSCVSDAMSYLNYLDALRKLIETARSVVSSGRR